MEQSDHLCSQHPQWTAVDRALRRDHHQELKEQHLSLQTHFYQGKKKKHPPKSALIVAVA